LSCATKDVLKFTWCYRVIMRKTNINKEIIIIVKWFENFKVWKMFSHIYIIQRITKYNCNFCHGIYICKRTEMNFVINLQLLYIYKKLSLYIYTYIYIYENNENKKVNNIICIYTYIYHFICIYIYMLINYYKFYYFWKIILFCQIQCLF